MSFLSCSTMVSTSAHSGTSTPASYARRLGGFLSVVGASLCVAHASVSIVGCSVDSVVSVPPWSSSDRSIVSFSWMLQYLSVCRVVRCLLWCVMRCCFFGTPVFISIWSMISSVSILELYFNAKVLFHVFTQMSFLCAKHASLTPALKNYQ